MKPQEYEKIVNDAYNVCLRWLKTYVRSKKEEGAFDEYTKMYLNRYRGAVDVYETITCTEFHLKEDDAYLLEEI